MNRLIFTLLTTLSTLPLSSLLCAASPATNQRQSEITTAPSAPTLLASRSRCSVRKFSRPRVWRG